MYIIKEYMAFVVSDGDIRCLENILLIHFTHFIKQNINYITQKCSSLKEINTLEKKNQHIKHR